MQELIAQEPKNWLQLYVDAVTEKDPYKRLALVRRLREVPRHDESDENPERPRFQPAVPRPIMARPAVPRPAPAAATAPGMRMAEPASTHKIRKSKPKAGSKSARRVSRLRRA